MKAIILTLILMTGAYSLSAQSDNDKVKQIVESFIKSTDTQDANELTKTMFDEAMRHVIFGPKLLSFSKQEYVDQIKAKKVGGQPRTMEFGKTVMSGSNIAMVQLTATSSVIKFHYQITLFQVSGDWKIISISTETQRL